MATDIEQRFPQPEPETLLPQNWANVHAWRALGQLRAEEAVRPLVEFLVKADQFFDEWAADEIPMIFKALGPVVIPALRELLHDDSNPETPRHSAAVTLSEIGCAYPESRSECIAVLTGMLEDAEHHPETVNAFVVYGLMDLKAVESAELIEKAFAADSVDEEIVGEWEDVRFKMGLGPPPRRDWRVSRSRNLVGLTQTERYPPALNIAAPKDEANRIKAKARRKLAKKSRKQNRKKR
jgi:HEAT repeat protein